MSKEEQGALLVLSRGPDIALLLLDILDVRDDLTGGGHLAPTG